MLAYVFSHRAADGADRAAYESGLKRFHAALAEVKPDGFISSTTYRVPGGYADWYLLGSSAALDVLNEAAITGARSRPHNDVARSAAGGSGKLMSLVSGAPSSHPSFEVGLTKPPLASYAEFYELLKPWTSRAGVALWKRMMVLGPPPEFCLISPAALELPAEMSPEMRSQQPI